MRLGKRLNVRIVAASGALALVAVACDSSASNAPAVESIAGSSPEVATPAPAPTRRPALPGDAWPDWPKTDFTRTTVDLDEVIRGCPGRECIPALDALDAVTLTGDSGVARFEPASMAGYPANFPVAVLRVGDDRRGYPLHILTWHEILNDTVGGIPVAVTFCPLCNTAIAFDRRVAGERLDFAVSGNLRNSDLIMWDRQTESWWQQATGEGIAGEHAGQQLKTLSLSVVSFGDFSSTYPGALVLSEDTGLTRDYGINPYDAYDTFGSRPFLFDGAIDPRLDGLERVVGLGRGGNDFVAVPFGALSQAGVAHVDVDGKGVVVFWTRGTASALGAPDIAKAKDVGAGAAFERTVNGQPLTFEPDGEGLFRDTQTGSTWDIFGRATSGQLAGQQLAPIVHTTEFWFAWAAFRPGTRIWDGD